MSVWAALIVVHFMQEVAYRKDFKRGKLWWIEETAAAGAATQLFFL